MPNAKYLAHLAYQTQKTPFIRCSKSYYFCHMWTVPSQICHCTNNCGISLYYLFIPLSLSSLHQSHPQTPILSSQTPLCLSVSHSLFFSASTPPCSPRRWRSLLHSPTLEIRSHGSSCSLSSSPAVHQDRTQEPNRLPARRWREFDFQHDQANDWVDGLGQGGDYAWVGVVDCWGDL